MIYKHLSPIALFIGFDKSDWNNGLAHKAIEIIKSIDSKHRRYNPNTKMWYINKKEADKEILTKLYNLPKEVANVELEDFDVEKWLKETFDGVV